MCQIIQAVSTVKAVPTVKAVKAIWHRDDANIYEKVLHELLTLFVGYKVFSGGSQPKTQSGRDVPAVCHNPLAPGPGCSTPAFAVRVSGGGLWRFFLTTCEK